MVAKDAEQAKYALKTNTELSETVKKIIFRKVSFLLVTWL